ncbi:hypothetical protein V5799_003233 [Amblyomma americanum]|uniref:CCHC-type domain-containing protein n=1 Tax=Amblyomma americanum TaxID=6943 RepID=A0AAQ4D9J5_AMBAM
MAPFSGAPARYIIHWCHHCGSKGHRPGDCLRPLPDVFLGCICSVESAASIRGHRGDSRLLVFEHSTYPWPSSTASRSGRKTCTYQV